MFDDFFTYIHHLMGDPFDLMETPDTNDDLDTENDQDTKDDPDTDDDTTNQVLHFLRVNTRIFDLLPESTDLPSSVSTLIKGAVQSGKSRIIFGLCLLHSVLYDSNVLVIVRNFTDDYDQFQRNFISFLDEYAVFLVENYGMDYDDVLGSIPSFFYLGNVRSKDHVLSRHEQMCQKMTEGRCVMIALANDKQIGHFNDCIDHIRRSDADIRDLYVIIDEADQLIYSEGDKFTPQLSFTLEQTKHYYGISATIYDAFYDSENRFNTERIFLLTPSSQYKGIDKLLFRSVEKTKKNLLGDEDLERFLVTHSNHSPFDIVHQQKHPMIAMIKTEHLITRQDDLMTEITTRYPMEYTVITYNGTFSKVYSPALVGVRMVLPRCHKRQAASSTDRIHVFSNCGLSYILQYLKENGGADRFPRILIISYNLVGRGINIVSADFGWHLTHMFYRPSKGTSVTSMIQSMRLCGIYNDNIPLTCHMEKDKYEDMYKGYMLQEDMFRRIRNTGESLSEWMKTQQFLKDKIPNGNLYRTQKFRGEITDKKEEDEGMSLDEFNQGRCITKTMIIPALIQNQNVQTMDPKELHRLTNDRNGMFKKWADITNQSAIARFMREGLDPRREYTKREMTDLWKNYSNGMSTTALFQAKIGTSVGYGNILVKLTNNNVRMYPELVQAFEKYF
jgi:hypothetical protein